MIALPGAIGFGALQKFETQGGINTTGDAALTAKMALNFAGIQALSLNDLVLCTIWVRMIKGVTLGNNLIEMRSDGAGTLNWMNSTTPPRWAAPNVPAGATWEFSGTLWGRVTVAGGIQISLFEQSTGSDGNVEAYMKAIAIRGSN